MKRILSLSLLLICSTSLFAGDFLVNEYGGMNTVESSLLIPNTDSPDMDNCDTDGISLSRRKGQTLKFAITYPTWTVLSMGSTKNTTYDRLLVAYGPHIELFNTAWTAVKMIHSTATPNFVWDFASYQGNIYATNGTDDVFYTDGNTRTTLGSAPLGTSIVFFNDTCWISNTAGDKSSIQYSAYSDATDWTTGSGTEEGRLFSVADEGDQVVDLEVLGNSVLILCSKTILKAVGYQNPYQVIEVDKSVGCKSKGSVYTHRGLVYFLGSDGQYHRTDGSLVETISDEKFHDDFAETGLAQRSANFYTASSQQNFTAGITSHTSTSISPGNVVLSTGTTVYTSASDWNAWTLTNIDTTTVSGGMILASLNNPDAEFTTTGVSEQKFSNYLTQASTGSQTFTLSAQGIVNIVKIDFQAIRVNTAGTATVSIYTDGTTVPGTYLGSKTINIEDISTSEDWNTVTFDSPISVSPSTKYWLVISISGATGASDGIWWSYIHGGGYTGGEAFIYGDAWEALDTSDFKFKIYANTYNISGQAISPIIDTNDYIATIDNFNLVWGLVEWSSSTVNNTTNKIYVRTSTDSAMGDAPTYAEQTDETQITESVKRYIQIKSTFTTTYSTQTPQLNNVALNWATTGYFISQEVTISDINSWGLFEAVDSKTGSGATIAYFTYSNSTITTNSDLKDVITWTAQTNNSAVAVSTNNYVWFKSVYEITVGSQAPSVNAVTFNWISGSNTIEDMTVIDINDILYFGIMQTNESSTNDGIFVYDIDLQAWWKYNTGVYPRSFFNWKGTDLIASSTSGVVYSFLEGDTDNGADIDAYFYTKHLTGLGGPSPVVSTLDTIFFASDQQTSGNLLIDYYLNGVTTAENTFTLDQTGGSTFHFDYFKFPLATNAQYWQFKIYNDSGSDFTLHWLVGTTVEHSLRLRLPH